MIGLDIKEVLSEVGVSITIVRDSGDITGEYTMFAPNAQVTKPFIREFFLDARLAYDTDCVVGDVIEFNSTGDRYLIMNKTPTLLEDEVYQYNTVLYKTNVVCDILRPSEGDWPTDTYHRRTIWTSLASSQDVLITTPLYGHELDESSLGPLQIEVHEMYVPASIGIRALDRVRVSSSEYYRVTTVKPRRYDGVDVVELSEDTRPTTSTTTTSTTSTSTTSTSTSSSSSTTTTTV